jgi:putative transposase
VPSVQENGRDNHACGARKADIPDCAFLLALYPCPCSNLIVSLAQHGARSVLENQFLIHDRDSIFSRELDEQLRNDFKLKVLRTPVRTPKANAYCERLVGTVRRECLDFMTPLNKRHLRMILRTGSRTITKDVHIRAWVLAFQRQHWKVACVGPRIHGHRLPRDCEIRAWDILGGLHHEYWLEQRAA